MANVIRTDRTYATVANAQKALDQALAKASTNRDAVRWLIAVSPDGRFAPVLVGAEYIGFIHVGLTVVG